MDQASDRKSASNNIVYFALQLMYLLPVPFRIATLNDIDKSTEITEDGIKNFLTAGFPREQYKLWRWMCESTHISIKTLCVENVQLNFPFSH